MFIAQHKVMKMITANTPPTFGAIRHLKSNYVGPYKLLKIRRNGLFNNDEYHCRYDKSLHYVEGELYIIDNKGGRRDFDDLNRQAAESGVNDLDPVRVFTDSFELWEEDRQIAARVPLKSFLAKRKESIIHIDPQNWSIAPDSGRLPFNHPDQTVYTVDTDPSKIKKV